LRTAFPLNIRYRADCEREGPIGIAARGIGGAVSVAGAALRFRASSFAGIGLCFRRYLQYSGGKGQERKEARISYFMYDNIRSAHSGRQISRSGI
jgi:hypothetical protein